jgi:hypothetical protein
MISSLFTPFNPVARLPGMRSRAQNIGSSGWEHIIHPNYKNPIAQVFHLG